MSSMHDVSLVKNMLNVISLQSTKGFAYVTKTYFVYALLVLKLDLNLFNCVVE